MCNRGRSALTQMVNFKTPKFSNENKCLLKLISGQHRNLGLCRRLETIVAMIRNSGCTLQGAQTASNKLHSAYMDAYSLVIEVD